MTSISVFHLYEREPASLASIPTTAAGLSKVAKQLQLAPQRIRMGMTMVCTMNTGRRQIPRCRASACRLRGG